MADEEAGIQERFVFGSMWKTCALHVNIGCSLRSIIIQINNNESNNTFISLHQSFFIFLFSERRERRRKG